MPAWMDKAQEKDWDAASKIVEEHLDKKKLKDDDYALVMHIWKNMEKAHRGDKKKKKKRKRKGKKKSELVYDLKSLADMLDQSLLFSFADRLDKLIANENKTEFKYLLKTQDDLNWVKEKMASLGLDSKGNSFELKKAVISLGTTDSEFDSVPKTTVLDRIITLAGDML